MGLEQVLAQRGLSAGRTGRRGRVWHFWFRLHEDHLGYCYKAMCGIKTKTIKRPQPSWDWAKMKVCAKCNLALTGSASEMRTNRKQKREEGNMEKPTDNQVVITGIAIAYHTKLQVSPSHGKGRIGPPLMIQEKDIPDNLRDQILVLAQEHARRYWQGKE